MSPPTLQKSMDVVDQILRRGGTDTHQFTIQSAYNLQQETSLVVEGDSNTLWSQKGPHRIHTFIWLVAH